MTLKQQEDYDRSSATACEVCGNTYGNRRHVAREQMFGIGDDFCYLECAVCGCLQLLDVPDDLSGFYPHGYYSFDEPPRHSRRQLLRTLRTALALRLGPRRSDFLFREGVAPYWLTLLSGSVGVRSRILDVGSGSGGLLVELQHQGFRHLLGLDPYIEADVEYPSGVCVLRQSLDVVEGTFDFIILNHSFEHMSEPQAVFNQIGNVLAPNGTALVRTPLADSLAWQRYGCDWVQLDAPRHLFVHTRRSIEILATKAHLRVIRVLYDSGAFQFWGSEQYRMGIPLESDRSYLRNPEDCVFRPVLWRSSPVRPSL